MADLTRIRDPHEVAAASPDPVMRAIAQRSKDARAELARLDNMLAFYAEESAAQSAAPPKPSGNGKVMPINRAPEKIPDMEMNVKASAFDDGIRSILVKGPLSLDDLLAEFRKVFPADTRNRDALRSALNKRRAFVGRVSEDDNRYCLVVADVSAAA